MASENDTYAVMGDLGDGKYIVRMYVSGHVVDEEFTATGAQDLHDQITSRMGEVDAESGQKVDVFKSDGHAIDMSGVE